MKYLGLLLLRFFVAVEGWLCVSQVTKVFKRVNTEAILNFDLSGYINRQTAITLNVKYHDNSPRAAIRYNSGAITYSKVYGVDVTADFSGNIVFTIENVEAEAAGIYYITSSSTPTKCSCLYILGTPTKPSVSVDNPSVGGRATFSCTSTSTTTPSNHSLGLIYSWRVDNIDNPSGSRYTYSTRRDTLTLSNIVKEDANKQFTCMATEDVSGGYTSRPSGSVSLNVIYGPENIDFSPKTVTYEKAENTSVGPVTCSANCNPACSFKWNKVLDSTIVSNNAVLNLGMMSPSKAGTYRCTATRSGGSPVTKNLTVNVIYGPRSIFVSPNTTTYRYNENVNPSPITCGSNCWLCQYSWTGPDSFTSSGTFLDLEGLTRTMHGHYTCIATNTKYSPKRQQQINIKIEVRYGPDSVSVTPTQLRYTVDEGLTLANIQCTADCFPACKYSWTKDGQSEVMSETEILSLGKIQKSYAGNYTCTAINMDVTSWYTSIRVSISVKYITIQPFYIQGHYNEENVTVNEHDSRINFKCIVDSNTATTMKIMFENDELMEQSNASSLPYSLRDVSCSDAGVYTCEASNGYTRKISNSVNLFVKCSPRPLRQIQRNITTVLQVLVTLSFSAIAYPKPGPKGFSWYKEKSGRWLPLLSNADLKISSSDLQSNLTLLNVSKEDYGLYRVTVTNEIGKYKQDLFLSEKKGSQQSGNDNNTALIVGITLGGVCCVLAIALSYFIITRVRIRFKGTSLSDSPAKQVTYANPTFSSAVAVNQEVRRPGATAQTYTTLSRSTVEKKDTYDVINRM